MTNSSTASGGGEAAGEPARAAGVRPKLGSASETVVLATFANRHAAERMLASLGREFRRKAKGNEVGALVITGNADGSFSLGQSRVLTTSGLVSAGVGVTVASLAGLMGMMSALRGGRTVVHAARTHEKHVGADAQRLRDMLAETGPRASVLVVRCADPDEVPAILALAAERAGESWHGTRAEFVTGLEQAAGNFDWLLGAFEQPSEAGGSGRQA